MSINVDQSVEVDMTGDAPMVMNILTAAEMFVAAKEALEGAGFSTERLDRCCVKQLREQQMATPLPPGGSMAGISGQEAQRARSIGVEYV